MRLLNKFLLLTGFAFLMGQSFAMTVFFKADSGKTFTLDDVNSDNTIATIKKNFQAKYGVAPEQQRLAFNGKLLEDDKTIASYEIPENATINILFRFQGD